MRIVIMGGSGFIGKELASLLVSHDHTVVIPSRKASYLRQGNLTFVHWDGHTASSLAEIIKGSDAVVNLLGENISAGRWTPERKKRITQSRIVAGTALVEAVSGIPNPPRVIIQASAVGYYGFWNEARSAPECTEKRGPGQGFLAATAVEWEASTAPVERFGIRRCLVRTAPVLSPYGGLLKKALTAFTWGMGGRIDSGRQPFAWIHLADEAAAIAFLLEHDDLQGPFNLAAPDLVTTDDFIRTLAKAAHRPAWLPLPGPLLRLILGEMATELLLGGQKAVPARLTQAGFSFRHPTLGDALHEVEASSSTGASSDHSLPVG